MKYYPRDWRADPRLRMCSLAARGLWADLLGYMHEAEPYGHLLIDNKKPDINNIASLVGRPLTEVRRAMAELSEHGVYSLSDNEVIFSRRMVRDAVKDAKDRANGKGGGNPSLTGKDKGGVNPQDKAPDKAQKPEARGKNSEANASSVCVSSSATSFSELRETQVERSSGRRKQKTPLPQDFETVADRGIARKLGWPEIRIDQQIQAFCDSARAHSRVYADWQAAWKNWCRSPYQQQNGKTNGLHGKHAGSILDAIDELPDFEGGSDQTTGENPLLGLPPR